MNLKTITVGALFLIALATISLGTIDAAQAYYCYYEWVWTPFGYQYQYICF